jgi:hypothetical protein
MASNVTANVFNMMNDLDELKGVIPEGLYINFSNLLKSEYQRQQQLGHNVINNITYNIGSININQQPITQPVEQEQEQELDESEQIWRVYDISNDGLWNHVLLDEDGQYNQSLEGDYDTVESNMHDSIDRYVCSLDIEEVKYLVERTGMAEALRLYMEDYGTPIMDEGDLKLYQQLLYGIVSSSLMVNNETPPRVSI